MITQVARWGNSLAVRIPSAMARTLQVKEGASVRLSLEKGELVMSPVVHPPVYTAAELAQAITAENNYAEVDFGRRVGSEFW
jgi:antitoxin MazE